MASDGGNNELNYLEESSGAKPLLGAAVFEPEKYWDCVEDFDITDEQKTELLQTLWNIMSAFVDLGWGVDSVQSIIPAWREISMESQGRTLEIEEKKIAPAFNENAPGAGQEKEGKK